MRELTTQELENQLAEQLPPRELMCCSPCSPCQPCCPPPPCLEVSVCISACVSVR